MPGARGKFYHLCWSEAYVPYILLRTMAETSRKGRAEASRRSRESVLESPGVIPPVGGRILYPF